MQNLRHKWLALSDPKLVEGESKGEWEGGGKEIWSYLRLDKEREE